MVIEKKELEANLHTLDNKVDRREHSYARISRLYVKMPDQHKSQPYHGTYHDHHLHLSPTPRNSK